MKNRPLAAICLVFLVIRCLVFWAGAKWEFPPEVLRMDGEKIRVSGRIFKREQREKGPTWYLRTGRILFTTPSGVIIGSVMRSQSQAPFIYLRGLLIREHLIPGLIIRIKISTE